MIVVVGTWEKSFGHTAIGNDLATTAIGAGYLTITNYRKIPSPVAQHRSDTEQSAAVHWPNLAIATQASGPMRKPK